MEYVQVAVGMALLFAAGDLLVRGSVSAAVRLQIPPILVGLTIVAFGTSAPELFVTVEAAIRDVPEIAVGNVIGSNIANVLLVIGLPALLAPLGDHSPETKRNYVIMMMVTVVAVALCWGGSLVWWQGALLLSLLALFLLDTYRCALAARRAGQVSDVEQLDDADPSMPPWKILGLIGLGLIGLPFGADLTVEGSMIIARDLGVSEAAIGLTIVALGTSLPELATTVMAAIRRQADIAIGNVIGSNVFNLLAILGVAATLDTIAIPQEFLTLNLWVMVLASLALAPFIWLRLKVDRVSGGVFLAAYVAYIAVVLMTPATPAVAG